MATTQGHMAEFVTSVLTVLSSLLTEVEHTPRVLAAVNDKTIINWRNFLTYINATNSWQYLVVQISVVCFSFGMVLLSQYSIFTLVDMVNP